MKPATLSVAAGLVLAVFAGVLGVLHDAVPTWMPAVAIFLLGHGVGASVPASVVDAITSTAAAPATPAPRTAPAAVAAAVSPPPTAVAAVAQVPVAVPPATAVPAPGQIVP